MGRHDEFLAVSEPDICVDGAAELFGSPTQDGFEVLETLDTNGDSRGR